MTVVVLNSGTSWTVPADWNDTTNQIETWGGGAGGWGNIIHGVASHGAGGGGAYSSISNKTGLTGSITIAIGAAGAGDTLGAVATSGGDTWFNGANLAASSVGSKGGVVGASGTGTGGAGGASASGVGTTKNSGGAGGSSNVDAGAGGGAAASPSGVGGAGTTTNTAGSQPGGAGGNSPSAGGGGTGGTAGGGNGNPGTANQAGGGGGGGGGTNGAGADGTGGAGALPGGGGGAAGGSGNNTAGGNGGGGQIRITYTPVASKTPNVQTDLPVAQHYRQARGAKDSDKWEYSGWQRSPLAADGPPTLSLGFVWEVPYNTRATAWRKHSMQGWQIAPLSGAFVNASPPEPVYEVPQRGRQLNSFAGWLQSPLSADSLPEIRQQPYEVPQGRKWARYDFSGWQQSPLIPELDIIGRRWTDLPVRTWRSGRWDYAGWQRGVIPDEYLVPPPQTDVPRGRYNAAKYQDEQASPIPADVVPPPIQPFYDLPQRTWTSSRNSYNGWQLAPQPEIMSPPQPQYAVPAGKFSLTRYQSWQQGVIPDEFRVPLPQTDVPPRGRATKQEYDGWVFAPQPVDVPPPLPSSMFFDLPQMNRAEAWRLQVAYMGSSAAPLPPDVAPAINHTWLPLVGVGNGGP